MSEGGSAPAAEKAARQRIYLMFINAKRPVGDVHIYILTPDGQPLDGMNVSEATKNNQNLLVFLERIVQNLHQAPGETITKPTLA